MQYDRVWKQLDSYQKEAVPFTLKKKTAALLFEQGTGKTWIAAGIIEALANRVAEFSGIMVVPLTNLRTTWHKMFRNELPQVTLCETLKQFKEAPFPKVWVIHYEGIKPHIKRLRKRGRISLRYTFIGYDESQRLKNRTSRQSRDSSLLSDHADYKIILTGTPIDKQPWDLWSQFRFLDPSILGENWTDFKTRFFIPEEEIDLKKYPKGSMRWKNMLGLMKFKKPEFNWDKLDSFLNLIAPYTMRVEAKDVLKLKPLHLVPVPVRMYGKQARVYDEIERHMVTTIEGSRVTAPLKGVQINKLQQICGGLLIDDEGNAHRVGSAKLRPVLRRVRKGPGPWVIFCKYLAEIEMLRDVISAEGIQVRTLTGKVKGHRREKLIEAFQAGKVRVLICQIKSGGVGIDLFRANQAICYSVTHSFIDFSQMIKRLHRRGQTREVTIFLMYAIQSVDEDLYSGLDEKHRLTNRVLTNAIIHRSTKWLSRKSPAPSKPLPRPWA